MEDKKMKRIIICLLLVVPLFAVCIHAQQSEADFTWKKSGDGVIISKYVGNSTVVQIPQQIQGMPVIGIGTAAFSGKQLTGVTIPNSVTSIEEHAFANNRLTNVTIPNGVTAIWDYAFSKNQISNLVIPDSVTSISIAAFADNPLTSISFGKGIDTLEERIFGIASFRNVSKITIGSNVSLFAIFLAQNSVVWIDFMEIYYLNMQRAGVYSVSDGTWSYEPK